MNVKRWLATIVVVGLVIAVATPAGAQRGGKKPKTSCDEAEYPATLQFSGIILADESYLPPKIYPSIPLVARGAEADGSPGDGLLHATFIKGRVFGSVENPIADGLAGNPLRPVHLDLSVDNDDPNYTTFHPEVTQIDVDPRFTLSAYTADTLESPDCGMLGMAVGDSVSYVGRLGIRWFELDLVPVDLDASSDQLWTLRHKPFDIFGNPPTYLNVVRTDRNTWMMTSRTDSSPTHFASLERYGSGKGKPSERQEKTFSKPIMPVQIVIMVAYDGDCAVPIGGS